MVLGLFVMTNVWKQKELLKPFMIRFQKPARTPWLSNSPTTPARTSTRSCSRPTWHVCRRSAVSCQSDQWDQCVICHHASGKLIMCVCLCGRVDDHSMNSHVYLHLLNEYLWERGEIDAHLTHFNDGVAHTGRHDTSWLHYSADVCLYKLCLYMLFTKYICYICEMYLLWLLKNWFTTLFYSVISKRTFKMSTDI